MCVSLRGASMWPCSRATRALRSRSPGVAHSGRGERAIGRRRVRFGGWVRKDTWYVGPCSRFWPRHRNHGFTCRTPRPCAVRRIRRRSEGAKRTNRCLSPPRGRVARMTLRALSIRSATGAKRASAGLVRREQSELVPVGAPKRSRPPERGQPGDRPERSEVVPVVIFCGSFF